MQLTFGVILPHTKVFGGVKRFFEVGNILVSRNHKFIIFTPQGTSPDWFDFSGQVDTIDKLKDYSFDALIITEVDFLPLLKSSTATLKIFYAVLERRHIKRIVKEGDITVFVNSGSLYKYMGGKSRENVVKALGGIDLEKFQFREKYSRSPADSLTVLVYGRFYRKKKGTLLVVRACENLYKRGLNIKLLLFDTPVDDHARELVKNFSCKVPHEFFVDYPVKNVADLYHKADIFVSAERNAGWSNTSAEAMACGVPVIATKSGTEDFLTHEETGLLVWRHSWFIESAIKRLYHNEALRKELALAGRKKIEQFSWENLAGFIESYVASNV